MGIPAGQGAARNTARRRLSRAGPVPLRAEDALFLHAETPLLCQQVGAVLLLDAAPLQARAFRAAMRDRIYGVPELRRRLSQPRTRWRRPRWIADDSIDFEDRIRQVTLGKRGAPATLNEVVDAFFSARCNPYRSPWAMLLVRGLPAGRTAVVVKVHHTLGDSHTIIATLSTLFDAMPLPAGQDAMAPSDGTGGDGTAGRGRARLRVSDLAGMAGVAHEGDPARTRRPGRPLRARAAARAVRGLCHLAAAGHAPAASVCGPFTCDRRRYVPVALPARDVAMTARGLNAGIADLLLTVIAEALGRLLRARGEETAGRVIRVAVPRARPGPRGRCRRSSGNRSAAVSLDLPIGPLPLAERLAVVRGQVTVHLRRGEPEAAALVLYAMNFLPPPLQRWIAARLYQHRWFNMVVSVFPGVRRGHRLLGARVEEVYPVLALADGVGLAIGAMTWERSLSVGILADDALVPDVDRLSAAFTEAFRAAVGAAGERRSSGRFPHRPGLEGRTTGRGLASRYSRRVRR